MKGLEIYESNNFTLCYNILDEVETRFIKSILAYIINYPIDWYNFLENVMKNNLLISYSNNAIIFSIEILAPQLKNSFKHIYDIMEKCGVIINKFEAKGFLVINVYSETIRNFFQKSGLWLEYITYLAFYELGFNAFQGCLIKTNDGSIQEVDVLVNYNSILFITECKDTYKYSNYDFLKLCNLKKKLKVKSYLLFVYTKDSPQIDLDNLKIDVIKYKYNYSEFKEQLKEIMIRKLIKL